MKKRIDRLNRVFVCVWTVLIFVNISSAGERPGFAFLNSELSARGAALSGAMVAKRAEIHGLFHNPASIAGIGDLAWSANYINHLLDMSGSNVMLAKTFESGTFGIGLASMDYGSFKRLDDFGNDLGGEFSADDILLSFGYGYELSSAFSTGINVKWASSNIDQYSANAIALDIGFTFIQMERDLSIGGGLFNLGKSTAFIDTEDPMPTNFRLGMTKKLAHLPLQVNLEGIWLTYGNWKVLASGELTISPNFNLLLGLNSNRLDLNTSNLSEDFYSGGTIGFALMFEKWRIDYALSSYGGAGTLQRFGISNNF